MASTEGVSYNVTIPHTSPMVMYTSDWWADCPITNGSQVCGDGQTVTGTHFTNVTGAKFQIYFWGPSLYIYGDADAGMTLTLKVNGGPEVTLVPGGGMLAAVDDISTLCNGTTYSSYYCEDQSNVAPGSSSYSYNYAYLTATQYVVGAKVSFSKAVVPFATHRSGASVSLKTYTNSDSAIQFTTGWTRNGTYMQTGSTSLAQSLNLAFDGTAIWVWGFCGKRAAIDSSSYGTFTLNGHDNFVTDSAYDYSAAIYPQDKKCLVLFRGGLYDTGNTLKYDSGGYTNFQLDSIDVLQVTGGTFLTTSTGFSFGTSTPNDETGKSNGTSLGVLVAVPVALIALFVAGGIALAIFLRKQRKARNANREMMGGATIVNPYATTSAGPLTPETKHTEHGTPSQTTGYLTYTPPPPANS